jgi:hypothetical protein
VKSRYEFFHTLSQMRFRTSRELGIKSSQTEIPWGGITVLCVSPSGLIPVCVPFFPSDRPPFFFQVSLRLAYFHPGKPFPAKLLPTFTYDVQSLKRATIEHSQKKSSTEFCGVKARLYYGDTLNGKNTRVNFAG